MDGQLEDLRLIANPLHFQVKVIKTKKIPKNKRRTKIVIELKRAHLDRHHSTIPKANIGKALGQRDN